jgi:hypothetical protein
LVRDDEIRLGEVNEKTLPNSAERSNRLSALLAESAAYRRYYYTADKDSLVIFSDER